MLAALLACGCSSDANNNNNTPATFEEACAQVPGCQSPENAVDGPSVAIWQVMLQRDASGAASVGEVREVDVPSGTGVPQGPLWGAYRLVAYDAAGKVLDAQAIRFPERLVVETVDGTSEETDFTNKASSALGYLEVDASVAKIAITDADGNQLDARDAPAPGERRSASLAGVRRSAVLQATARTPCSHVLLLEQSDTALFTDAIVNEGYKLAPLPLSAQAVIQAALGRLTPLACAAVGRIAFVASDTTTTGAWVNGRFGDMMIINANFDVEGHTFDDAGLTNAVTRSILEGSVVHEAGHNVWRLLNMEGANNVAFADDRDDLFGKPALADLVSQRLQELCPERFLAGKET